MILDAARTADDAVGAQRRSAVHGDGRDGGGGADRGGGRPGHSHGGRPAGGAGAVDRDCGGAGRARSGAARLHLGARHSLAARAHRAALCARPIGCAVDAERVIVTTGSSAAFILAFLAMFEPGDRVAVASPGYPPYRHILTALGCEPVLIETSAQTRYAMTGEALARRAPQDAARRACWSASPANPTGTMMTRGGAARPDRGRRRRGHPFHLRRNLSRPRLCVCRRRPRRELSPNARGHQFVLEIFLHDRLARRLDGGAGAAGAADRAAAAESRDLGADAVADRRRGGVRGPRRDGGGQARLRGEPPNPDRGPAASRASTNSCRPTARFISMPTSRSSPPTVSSSPSGCWSRRTSRRRPASISIRFTAASFVRFSYARSAAECARRWSGSRGGSDRPCEALRPSRLLTKEKDS